MEFASPAKCPFAEGVGWAQFLWDLHLLMAIGMVKMVLGIKGRVPTGMKLGFAAAERGGRSPNTHTFSCFCVFFPDPSCSSKGSKEKGSSQDGEKAGPLP